MFNNSSHIDASRSTFNDIHRDQYCSARSTVHGNQTVTTIIHGNQVVQDSRSNLIETLRKMSAPSAVHDSAQRYPAPKCLEGTRIELLARITSWTDKPNEKAICWLNGQPGSGKSAVSQTIAEKYADENRLAASFFFSRQDFERRTTQHVVPTLTTQLFAFLPSIRPAVISALEKDYMVPMKVLREQMVKLLLEPLSTATEAPERPILVILDALDECDDENLVSELLTLVALLPHRTSLPLRLLITSRSEPWLQSHFHRPEVSSVTLPLEMHVFSADGDIRLFLRRALDNTYDEHLQVMKAIPRPWPSSDDLERIVKKAAGLFIFALTVVKFVGAKTHNPLPRLQAILDDTAAASTGSAYAELDALYLDAISAFPDADVARLVFGVVHCMSIPMSISGLHKLLQQPDIDVRLVVPALSSVLLASEDGKQPIQFYHASFRDFLINPRRSQIYAIDPNASHQLIAQLCFEIMSNSLKRDMCGFGDPSKANSEVSDLVKRRQTAFDEALLYACRFWSRHLAQLPSDGIASNALLSALKKFSSTVLLCWIETLSIFGELENAMVMLRQGTSWLKTLRDVAGDTATLFQQAERLLVLYMEPISQCALHIYATAILFVPDNNIIYNTFKHQLYGTLTMWPALNKHFDILRRSVNVNGPIHSVVFSPDGDWIATAGAGVQLWNALSGGNVASLGDRSSTSLLVSFSPSSTFLAAAFEDGGVAVWDSRAGREHLKHEHCHTEPITCIEFSADSSLLASGSRDNFIQVWSVEAAQHLYQLTAHAGPVTSLVFSSDSQKLFSGSEDNLVIIWDMSSGKVARRMMGHRKAVNCVAVSKDGSLVVSGSEDKTVKLWETSSGKCTRTLSKGHSTGIRSVHFFDEDRHLVAACDKEILSWDVSRNKSESIWAVEKMMKSVMRITPVWQAKVLGWGLPQSLWRYLMVPVNEDHNKDHFKIAYASRSPSFAFIYYGSVMSGSLVTPMNKPPLRETTTSRISVSSDGLWAATGNPQGLLEILDLSTKRVSWEEFAAMMKLDNIFEMVPSPNGKRFILNLSLKWCLMDENHRMLKKIDIGAFGPLRVSDNLQFKFSRDGSIFFCVAENIFDDDKSTVRVFNAVTGELRTQFKGLHYVHSSAASADGAWIACCHGSVKVAVFGVSGGGWTSMSISEDVAPINVFVFSEDAQSLIGGSKKGVIHVWNRVSGECTATFEGSNSQVTALAYGVTSNEMRVGIGREDGSISVWAPSKLTSHNILPGDQAAVKNVDFIRFSDDLSTLTSSGEDGTVFTWVISDTDVDTAQCKLCTLSRGDGEGIGSVDRDSGAQGDSKNQTMSPPHLLSRSNPEDIVDGLFNTAYSASHSK